MKKQHITPEDVGIKFPSTLPPSVISHAVRCSGERTSIYVSGQVSTDENGDVVAPGNLEAQIHQAFRNLEKVLKSAGATLKDVVSLNAYMTDINQVGVFRRIRTQYLVNDPPAITTVGVTGLAGPGLVFELAAIAESDSAAPRTEGETGFGSRRSHADVPEAGGGGGAREASDAESEKVLAVLRALRELERSENPATRLGCRGAAQQMWQVAFELGLPVEDQ